MKPLFPLKVVVLAHPLRKGKTEVLNLRQSKETLPVGHLIPRGGREMIGTLILHTHQQGQKQTNGMSMELLLIFPQQAQTKRANKEARVVRTQEERNKRNRIMILCGTVPSQDQRMILPYLS